MYQGINETHTFDIDISRVGFIAWDASFIARIQNAYSVGPYRMLKGNFSY